MTTGFQQQVPTRNALTRSAPEPQHGKKSDEIARTLTEQRSFTPRPGR
jgi:hypothetical protein